MPLTREEELELEELELDIEIEELEALEAAESQSLNSNPVQQDEGFLKSMSDDISKYGVQDEIINAATLGLGPRVRAAGGTAGDVVGDLFSGKGMPDISDSYDRNVSQQFQERDAWRKENPNLAIGASIGGAFANPLSKPIDAWMRGGKFLGNQAPKLTKMGTPKPVGYVKPPKPQFPKIPMKQQMGRGATAGGGLSAVQGYNEADGDLMDRVVAGSQSGGVGAALGGGLPPVVKGGAYALQQLAGALAKIPKGVETLGRMPMADGMQDTMAWRKLAEALERDGYTLESAAKKLDELGPQAVIADLGDNTRSLAYSVYSRPSKGSSMVFNKAESRQKGVFPDDDPAATLQGGQRNRITEKADELFPDEYAGKVRQPQITKLYNEAYAKNQNIQSDKLDELIKRPAGKRAFKQAVEDMQNEGDNVAINDVELNKLYYDVYGESAGTGRGIASGMKLKTWDYIKRAYDDQIELAINKGDSPQVRRLEKAQKQFLNELDNLTEGTAYAEGRNLSHIEFKNEDAFKFGQKFMRQDVRLDELQGKLLDMSEEQLHNYRIGAIRQLQDNVGKLKAGANKAQALLDDEALQKKIKTVFGDNQKFGEYLTLLKNEAEMAKLRTTLGGSRTAKNLAANEDATIDSNAALGGVLKMKAGNWIGGGVDIIKALGNRAFMREKTADTLGKALTGTDLSGITRKYTPKKASPQSRSNLSSKITIGASPQIGRKRKPDIVLRKSILDAR